MGYRENINNNLHSDEEVKSDMLYIEESAVMSILDNIESELGAVLDTLELIQGLSEIDHIRNDLKKLHDDLY